MTDRPEDILVISQVYPPDPAAVGQYMHEAAAELARRGHRVTVLTSRTGYDDPSRRYPWRETRDGVRIKRLALSGFGKRSMVIRLLGGILFVIQATLVALLSRRVDRVLISTSPPMAPAAALVLRTLRGAEFLFWAMDINPDQMIAIGAVSARSLPARVFDALIHRTLRSARAVVALDQYMADRLTAKVDVGERMTVLPPWPLAGLTGEPGDPSANAFRRQHGWADDELVVMYSGNLSPVHPLDTLLAAAARLADDPGRVRFVFVGGGAGRDRIEEIIAHGGMEHVELLDFQPWEQLGETLAAADVHVVSMGEAMVGIVHPCKVYGAMAVARPVLLLGPEPCHLGDLLREGRFGWRVDHGDVERCVELIDQARALSSSQRQELGRRGRAMLAERFDRQAMCEMFCGLMA